MLLFLLSHGWHGLLVLCTHCAVFALDYSQQNYLRKEMVKQLLFYCTALILFLLPTFPY